MTELPVNPVPLDCDIPQSRMKLMVLAHSGAGKTGALAALLAAGYTVWLIDFEEGAETLINILRDEYPNVPLTRLHVKQITNPFKDFGGKVQPSSWGWQEFNRTLASWKNERKANDAFWAYTLTRNDILVLDSLSGLCDLCRDHVLTLNSQMSSGERIQDYKQEQALMEFIFRALCGNFMKAHLIVNCHVQDYRDGGETIDNPKGADQPKLQIGGKDVGFPKTTGKNLSRTIARHFNNILTLTEERSLEGPKRFFMTQSDGVIRVKNSAPFAVKKRYPIKTGLADFFQDILKEKPTEGN